MEGCRRRNCKAHTLSQIIAIVRNHRRHFVVAAPATEKIMSYHPKKNDKDHLVELKQPNQPSAQVEWMNSMGPFTVVPEGEAPSEIGGIAAQSWSEAPDTDTGWEALVAAATFKEPAFKLKPGKHPASGVVVLEADGQVWAVSPSNQFGGYVNTFPKGTIEAASALSLRANSIKEAYEKSGLKVELVGFLVDSDRTATTTRYYLARRVGGNPADMGWKSQAVHLVPRHLLPSLVTHKNDAVVLAALKECTTAVMKSDIMRLRYLTSVHRILETVEQFKRRYGVWPTRLLLDSGMAEAIPEHILTPIAWDMLKAKMEVVTIREGTVIAEAQITARYEYCDDSQVPEHTERADIWIWGVQLFEWSSNPSQRGLRHPDLPTP